jgi:glyceraldehyde 3-phosphate dehydrogenase
MVTYGINGIGRIGKFALKALIEREAKVSWINDSSGTIDLHRHLLEYDSVHGKWDADFSNDEKSITINDKKIIFQTSSTIEILSWKMLILLLIVLVIINQDLNF